MRWPNSARTAGSAAVAVAVAAAMTGNEVGCMYVHPCLRSCIPRWVPLLCATHACVALWASTRRRPAATGLRWTVSRGMVGASGVGIPDRRRPAEHQSTALEGRLHPHPHPHPHPPGRRPYGLPLRHEPAPAHTLFCVLPTNEWPWSFAPSSRQPRLVLVPELSWSEALSDPLDPAAGLAACLTSPLAGLGAAGVGLTLSD